MGEHKLTWTRAELKAVPWTPGFWRNGYSIDEIVAARGWPATTLPAAQPLPSHAVVDEPRIRERALAETWDALRELHARFPYQVLWSPLDGASPKERIAALLARTAPLVGKG